MKKKLQKTIKRQRASRVRRVRAKVMGTANRPRLVVNRSLRYLSAQLIDDQKGHTLAAVHGKDLQGKGSPMERAAELGKQLGEVAKKAGITEVVFDRRYYKYHGRIKTFAQAAREAGLKF